MAKILKKDAKKMMARVSKEHVFRCCDGRSLKNMEELENAFNTMADETFSYHSNGEKSDFSNWVRDVIKDEKLARDLSKAGSRSQAAKSVKSRLTFLNNKVASK